MKALKIILFSLLLIAVDGSSLFAQQKHGVLRGLAVNVTNGETIPFANVVVKDTDNNIVAGGTSSIDGLFIISPIAEGFYTVEASYIGFTTEVYKEVEIKTGKTKTISIFFTEEITTLEECVIIVKVPLISKCCNWRCCYISYNEDDHQSFPDSISMYPNPSSGELNIQSLDDLELVTVTNMNGQTVAKIRMDNPNKVTTNLHHLAPATYVVHFTKGGQRVSKLWVLAY